METYEVSQPPQVEARLLVFPVTTGERLLVFKASVELGNVEMGVGCVKMPEVHCSCLDSAGILQLILRSLPSFG